LAQEESSHGIDTLTLYALFWRWISLAVHRYGSSPTGEILVVITLVLLDDFDYQPTVTELADIVQLPKSSVSRYVAAEMNAGMLEEFIDPTDRRRRRLRPTALAKAEQVWHRGAFKAIFDRISEVAELDRHDLPQGPALVKLLKNLNLDLIASAKEAPPKAS
jgi:DNA-binding MarR family transcriptional regulator